MLIHLDFLRLILPHTDISAKVRRSLHLDMQILIDFANDLYCMADSEMRVLCVLVAFSFL
jgi:hypothetical protein